ncbi:MAG: hypothetical protein AB7O49_11605 [Sphingomonadales bacterium]
MSINRRQVLKRGAAGITLVAAGGLVWRAWDNGVFSAGQGAPYELWSGWRAEALDGPQAVARAGILAASAHNTQPWTFRLGEDSVALSADPARHLGSFDPFRREMALSLGCAVENMALTAGAQGVYTLVRPEPGLRTSDLDTAVRAAFLLLDPLPTRPDRLFAAIDRRHTNRGPYDMARPLPPALKAALQALPTDPDTRLFLFDADPARAALGRLIVSSTATIIADPAMAADSARWFRFRRADIDHYRDGITLDAAGLSWPVNLAAKMIAAPTPEVADRQWLNATRGVHVASAPVFGVIAVRDLYGLANALEAGRLWQRIHLWATVNGLAAQPLNQPLELIDRARQLGKPPATARELEALVGDPAWRPTFVFRIGHAERSAKPSPRRAVDDVIMES